MIICLIVVNSPRRFSWHVPIFLNQIELKFIIFLFQLLVYLLRVMIYYSFACVYDGDKILTDKTTVISVIRSEFTYLFTLRM